MHYTKSDFLYAKRYDQMYHLKQIKLNFYISPVPTFAPTFIHLSLDKIVTDEVDD